MSETTIYAGADYDSYYERNVANFKIHEDFQRGLDDDHANENDLCMLELDKNILYSNGEQLDTGNSDSDLNRRGIINLTIQMHSACRIPEPSTCPPRPSALPVALAR